MKFILKRLRSKLGLLGIALVGLSFLIFSTFLLTAEWQEMSRDIIHEGELFAKFNSNAIFNDYLNYYSNPADGMFERFSVSLSDKLSSNTDIKQVALIGINGRIFFDSEEIKNGKYDGPDRFLEDSGALKLIQQQAISNRPVGTQNDLVAEIYAPVLEPSGKHVTSVKYVISYDSRWQRMQTLIKRIGMAFIPTIALSVFFLTWFAFSLAKPITELNRLAQKIGNSETNERLKVKSHDEIGQLAVSFNQMADNLTASRKKLHEYNRNLEQQIAQRTEELKKQNDKLGEQNQELERLNKTMIGREIKMIELKQEISDLRQQSDKKTPPEKKEDINLISNL